MSTDTVHKAKSFPMFAEFTDEELGCLIDLADVVNTADGDTIVRQDDPGDCMYVLLAGDTRITHRRGGRSIALGMLHPGDFFGEIALVDAGPRSADVAAVGACQLLKITQATVTSLAGVYPAAAFKFLISIGRILVSRLRTSNQRYIDSLLFPVEGKD